MSKYILLQKAGTTLARVLIVVPIIIYWGETVSEKIAVIFAFILMGWAIFPLQIKFMQLIFGVDSDEKF